MQGVKLVSHFSIQRTHTPRHTSCIRRTVHNGRLSNSDNVVSIARINPLYFCNTTKVYRFTPPFVGLNWSFRWQFVRTKTNIIGTPTMPPWPQKETAVTLSACSRNFSVSNYVYENSGLSLRVITNGRWVVDWLLAGVQSMWRTFPSASPTVTYTRYETLDWSWLTLWFVPTLWLSLYTV